MLSIKAPHLGSKDFGLKLKSMKMVNGKLTPGNPLTKLPPNCTNKNHPRIPGERCNGVTTGVAEGRRHGFEAGQDYQTQQSASTTTNHDPYIAHLATT